MATTPRMAPAFIATTPPPPSSSIRTPPTPKHGFSDPWEPYSPRKSARIASRQPTTTTTTTSTSSSAAHRTPSPQSSRRNRARTPTRISTRKSATIGASIMSPTQTPQKKRLPGANASTAGPSQLTAEETTSAAHALGLDKQGKQEVDSRTTSVTRRSGMLPTPVKTPKKAPTEAQAASIRAVARNLFYEGEASSTTTTTVAKTPRKPRVPKRYNGISMESFVAEEVQDPISIYTDSQDRVPAVDTRAENPFYNTRAATTAAPAQPPRRRSKRAGVSIPGEGSLHIDDALQREDGMVCVFRGKRIFRKFAENVDDEDVNSEDESLRIPLTRSSIQPRRLFQKALPEISPEDEEAATDIDEEYLDEMESKEEVPQTPIVDKSEHATPSAPRFGPAPTPPETRRSTRFVAKVEDATPSRPKSGRLFDNWPITKSRASSSEHSHKRTAEDTTAEPAAKRSRV